MIGTRYHFNDTYGEMIRSGVVRPRIYPCTRDGTDNLTPENCVFRPAEYLVEKRRTQGPWVFGCQMLLNPAGDISQGFKREWIRFIEGEPHSSGLNVYICVDPAHSKKRGSDYTVMAVIGLGPDNAYRLLDIVRDRLNLTERTSTLFDLVAKWRPIAVGYERYGLQADVEHIKREQYLNNTTFRIIEVGGSMSKSDRIKRLVPLFEQGRFLIPHSKWRTLHDKTTVDLVNALVEEELLAFPVATHDDMLDAIARILDEDLHARWPTSGAARDARHREPRVVLAYANAKGHRNPSRYGRDR